MPAAPSWTVQLSRAASYLGSEAAATTPGAAGQYQRPKTSDTSAAEWTGTLGGVTVGVGEVAAGGTGPHAMTKEQTTANRIEVIVIRMTCIKDAHILVRLGR